VRIVYAPLPPPAAAAAVGLADIARHVIQLI